MVTCYTCHRGDETPKTVPTIAGIYNTPPPDEPDEIVKDAPNAPAAAQILDKYIQALGGAQRVGALTSMAEKGTYRGILSRRGSQTARWKYTRKSPNQRVSIVHTLNGDLTTTYDGRDGWSAVPGAPVPVLALNGADLDGAENGCGIGFSRADQGDPRRLARGFPGLDRRPGRRRGAGKVRAWQPAGKALFRPEIRAAGAAGALSRYRL